MAAGGLKCSMGLMLCIQIGYSAASDPLLVDRVFNQSGIRLQIEQLPGHLLAGLGEETESSQPVPDGFHEAARLAAAEAFEVQNLVARVRTGLGESLDDADLRYVLAWLESEIGRRVTRLEAAANHPDRQHEIVQFAATLASNPPPAKRVQSVRALDQAARISESTMEATLGVQLAVATAIAASLPADQRSPVQMLAEMLDASRPRLVPLLQSQVRLLLLFTYQSLSDTELLAYLAFCQSPVGQRYNQALFQGLESAMIESAFRFGDVLTRILRHGLAVRGT